MSGPAPPKGQTFKAEQLAEVVLSFPSICSSTVPPLRSVIVGVDRNIEWFTANRGTSALDPPERLRSIVSLGHHHLLWEA